MEYMGSWSEIQKWSAKSSELFLKKLSRNDCGWADGAEFGHQNGVYIPAEIQKEKFFPDLQNVNSSKPHILESTIKTFWPDTGEVRVSNLKHYTNKGSEMHFTRVPKEQFSGLTPASFLLGGKLTESYADANYWFIVVDSASEEAEILESILNLEADFHSQIFDPNLLKTADSNETDQLIASIIGHINAGTLQNFISEVSKLPSPQSLAARAQKIYLENHKLSALDPYVISCPGDAIMQISRDIEYNLYKQAELRHRAAEVIKIVLADKDPITAVVKGFSQLDAIFLSASQHRKSRAGRSFEQHISQILKDGRIKYQEQAVTGGRRPDFVLPSLADLESKTREFEDALIISAKTTLRERWKQVTHEKLNCAVFLATVDDRVTSDAIEDMNAKGIRLIVPESLKSSKETCYSGRTNVITFREFFDDMKTEQRKSYRIEAVAV